MSDDAEEMRLHIASLIEQRNQLVDANVELASLYMNEHGQPDTSSVCTRCSHLARTVEVLRAALARYEGPHAN